MAAEQSERSNPVKRIRWATQRVSGKKGVQKRMSIFNRNAARRQADEKKRESTGTELTDPGQQQQAQNAAGGEGEEGGAGRTIYFNIPLPPSARDEQGRPLQQYKRNKIRTAKYTPLSFIPKNLWFQFQNVANFYFLAIIILDVRDICFHK
jgi:phospholipid-translocating ATPase